MTRLALLIEASDIKDHKDLPGAREDVEAYRTFFTSSFGGAWEDSEIKILTKPTKLGLEAWLRVAGTYDYSVVTFSGHGHHVRGKKIDETRVCINDTEEIAVHALNSGSPRTLVIADACRNVTVLLEKYAKSLQATLESRSAALHPNRQRCRALFEQGLARAEKGPIYMYSCGLDESANDSYSFSRFLTGTGQQWAQQGEEGTLWSDKAFNAAAAATTRRTPQQHPELDGGRRLMYFPFAVLAY